MRLRTIRALAVAMAMLLTLASARAQEHSLTETQVQAFKAVRARSEKKAAPLALKLAQTAAKIYENMLSEKEDQRLRRRLERDLDQIAVQLLNLKGQSIREMVAVLTPEQKQLLKTEMRKPGMPGDLSELIVRLFKLPEK